MLIPRLQTPRLLLTPPDSESESLYLRFYTDPEASSSYGGPLSAGPALSRLAYDLGVWHLHGFGVWIVRRGDDGTRVGSAASGKDSAGHAS
jgi:ribosomal-protein-alanine N-acetyltransferase